MVRVLRIDLQDEEFKKELRMRPMTDGFIKIILYHLVDGKALYQDDICLPLEALEEAIQDLRDKGEAPTEPLPDE